MTKRDGSCRLLVALVGAGMISKYHLRAWARLPDAVVVAVVDPDPSRRAGRAQQFGIANHYPDLGALFADEAVDALDIGRCHRNGWPSEPSSGRAGAMRDFG